MDATLKVSSRSTPNAVAGALAGMARTEGRVAIQVVGAGALNQAIKALAIARGYVAPAGLDLSCRPTFAEIDIDGASRTAIRLEVECAPAGVGSADAPAADAAGAGRATATATAATGTAATGTAATGTEATGTLPEP